MRPYSPSLVPPFSVVHSFSHMASLEDIADNLHSTEEKLGIVSSNLRLVNVDQQPETTSGAFGEELSQLEVANNKLKYRISHLKKSIADENTKRALHMTNVRSVITAIFRTALCKCYPSFNTTRAIIQASGAERFGDYKCVAAMPLANTLKQSGEVLSPRDVAQKILNNLPSTPFVIEKCEVAGPGFINVYVKRSYISELVSDILVKGVRPPPVERKLRVIVDFSSPNVAKEMHVGHLRSTIIGETICRLLEFFGHDVLRLNHVGDWGTQFGMLIAHLQDQFPDYSTVSPPIGDLQKFYRESKKRFDNDENFKKRAYNCVVKLQGNDPEVHQAWKLICDVSRKEFSLIYDRLGVKNQERGESFYEPMMPGIVKDLRGKGLAVIEDGATVMHIPGKLVPLMLAKSDGAHTYDTSDMAALRHRIEEEKGDWLIYVVDAGQGLHFETVFEGGCMAGYVADGVRIDHVGFGVVLGEDKKKLKTRSGDTVRLKDLLDEGLERSLERLKEKGRDKVLSANELKSAQESVAYGCIKYADLCHTRTNDYIFSFDKMLEDRGNTAVYLLYAYTRIKSILRVANVTQEQLQEAARNIVLSLDHEKEFKLAKCITRFSEVLDDVASDLFPHTLCDYIYELCTTMTEFYDACYCVEKDKETGEVLSVNMSRILLIEATRMVLQKSFHILGLDPVEKM